MGNCHRKTRKSKDTIPKNQPARIKSILTMSTDIPVVESDVVVTPDGKQSRILNSSDMDLTKTKSNMDDDLTPVVVRSMGYELNGVIGEGSFSIVYAASHKLPNGKVKKVAVKVIRYDKVPIEWKESKLIDEIQIGKHVKHPNIIHVEKVMKTSRRVFIFMDFAQANVADILKSKYKSGFPEYIAKQLFSQVINAVKYLHSKGVAHRDLKTDNLLLDSNNNIKITDFGFAKSATNEKELISRTSCGSRGYIAPEVFHPPYDPRPADVWSSGVILYEMLTNTMPFGIPSIDNKGTMPAYLKACKRPVIFPKIHLHKLSISGQELVRKLLTPNPKNRPSAETACQHPWLKIHTIIKLPTNFTSIKSNENQ